jgi:hypothetical protein
MRRHARARLCAQPAALHRVVRSHPSTSAQAVKRPEHIHTQPQLERSTLAVNSGPRRAAILWLRTRRLPIEVKLAGELARVCHVDVVEERSGVDHEAAEARRHVQEFVEDVVAPGQPLTRSHAAWTKRVPSPIHVGMLRIFL